MFWALGASGPVGAIPKDLSSGSTVNFYFKHWEHDCTLDRLRHALYVACREQAGCEANPTAAIIDSQSVKSAEKGGSATHRASTQAKRSAARTGTSLAIRKAF